MSEGTLRVALLARPGDASDRIDEALRAVGAEVVLVADPASIDESAVRDLQPRALVVALEPAIEDALEAFGTLLADPAYMVVFEDAELAVQRAGWDAARWTRHLAAKLHRHHDVLPPGAEDDADLHPSPGPLPPRAEVEDIDEAIAAFTDEAQQHADEVPADTGLDGLLGGLSLTDDVPAVPQDQTASPFDPVAFEMSELTLADETVTLDIAGLELADDGEAPAAAGLDLALEDDGSALDAVAFDAPAPDVGTTDGASEEGATETALSFDTGGLQLVDDSAPLPAAPAVAETPKASSGFDLGMSSLSLADPDSYGHGPERGAVLIEAGLGGPDAVRQLLAAIPEAFPRPVIVRLQLDGGRYDRLVRQMERVAALPVLLATANAQLASGQIYFLPPELGVHRDKGRLVFSADAAGELLPDALPPDDSAVLLLSGASRRIVDATASGSWSAALLAGQSPDGSYDPDAALALIERGGASGSPAELAAMLTERWLPSAAPATDFEEPEA
ncbi:MAG: chemotaxis protein [Luteimonas sp.]|nr:chemotaxis protein [Luteimonas sp.]